MTFIDTTVATSNLQAHMRLFKVARSVRKVKNRAHPDLWGFQEIGGLHKWLLIRGVLGRKYKGWRPKGDGSATPVAWDRKRYRVVRRLPWHLSNPTPVGRKGAGPARLRGKDAAVVILWDKHTKHHVALVNAHLAPSPWLDKARSDLHSKQVARLSALVAWIRHGHPEVAVFMVGDDNTTQRSRLAPLVHAGLFLGPDVKTHGHHALDRIASTIRERHMFAVPTDSDHDTLVGKF